LNALKGIFLAVLPGKENEFIVALIFFIIGASYLWICAYLYTPLYKNKFFLHYLSKSSGESVLEEEGRLVEDDRTGEEIEASLGTGMTFSELIT